MKQLKLDTHILVDFYCKEIRSILEFGAVVWHSGLTIKMRNQIERIQRVCINLILCDLSVKVSYFVGCTLLNLEPLYFRRIELCRRFIQKASVDPRHSDMFSKKKNIINTRRKNFNFCEYTCKTKRFFDSPLCYLTRLLSSNPPRRK